MERTNKRNHWNTKKKLLKFVAFERKTHLPAVVASLATLDGLPQHCLAQKAKAVLQHRRIR